MKVKKVPGGQQVLGHLIVFFVKRWAWRRFDTIHHTTHRPGTAFNHCPNENNTGNSNTGTPTDPKSRHRPTIDPELSANRIASAADASKAHRVARLTIRSVAVFNRQTTSRPSEIADRNM